MEENDDKDIELNSKDLETYDGEDSLEDLGISLKSDLGEIQELNRSFDEVKSFYDEISRYSQGILEKKAVLMKRLEYLLRKVPDQAEIIQYFIDLFNYNIAIKKSLEKNKDHVINNINEILREFAELYIRKRHVIALRKQAQLELDNLRAEEEKLRGRTRIEKCIILCKELKDYIEIINHLEKDLIADGENVEQYNSMQKLFMREFGDYEFTLYNAKICQSKVNQILKHLIVLISNKSDHITQFEQRSFLRVRGILKIIHYRINWLIGQSFETEESNPIEILRIFSSLEPTLTNLSALEEDDLTIEEYDKIVHSFKDLYDEEKVEFMKVYFKEDYIEKLDINTQKNVFIRLLTRISLNPNQLIDQIGKWDKINSDLRKKFLAFLKVELTEKEKIDLAEKEINELKASWG